MANGGEIRINHAAAQRDISNLKNAQQILDNAQNSISRLMATAQDIKGDTGMAIQEKASQLHVKLAILNQNLGNAATLIQKVVDEKDEQDRVIGAMINKGGV